MKNIALATYSENPGLAPDDRFLVPALELRAINGVPVAWDDPTADWAQFDAVILRSTWNYHKYPDQFRAWVAGLEARRIKLFNTPPVVLWNMDKTYLRGLERDGVRTIPTEWTTRGESRRLSDILAARGWTAAVIKPAFGASAYGIFTVTADEAEARQGDFEALLADSNVLVQPLMEEIRQGELSIMFFAGIYSHTVHKIPGAGTIFVNTVYGGRSEMYQPAPAVIDTARTILEIAARQTRAAPFLFARADGVLVDGEFVLMELELIEPVVFLEDGGAESCARLADAIAAAI